MDARRIAEIRELAKSGRGALEKVPRADLIALCDLAAEAVAMKQAVFEFGFHALEYVTARTAEILSSPKHERRG